MTVSDWISLAGVLSTGIFTFMVWRATQQTAIATIEMKNLNQEIAERELNRQKNESALLSTAYRKKISNMLLDMYNCQDLVARTDPRREQFTSALKNMVKTVCDVEISESMMSLHLSEQEIIAFDDVSRMYEVLRQWAEALLKLDVKRRFLSESETELASTSENVAGFIETLNQNRQKIEQLFETMFGYVPYSLPKVPASGGEVNDIQ